MWVVVNDTVDEWVRSHMDVVKADHAFAEFVSILDVETLLFDSGTSGFVHTRIVIKWSAARLVRLR